MDGMSRTWGLMKQSFLVLTGDAKFIAFPIPSGLVLLAIDGAAFRTYGSQLKGPHIRPDLRGQWLRARPVAERLFLG